MTDPQPARPCFVFGSLTPVLVPAVVRVAAVAVLPLLELPDSAAYRELGGSGNSEVNNGRQIRLGAVFILFYFQFTSTLKILTYRTYKV